MKSYWTAPEMWHASTIVCIGGGPSLTPAQVEACKDRLDERGVRVRVIAINNAYKLAPWADILYFCDCKWWGWHRKHLGTWKGMIVRLQGGGHDFGDPRIKVLRNENEDGKHHGGLADRRDALRPGKNSGYQAINLAVHLGARRIVLIGYDMASALVDGRPKTHWDGDHPGGTAPQVFERLMLPHFDTLVQPLAARGVEIINATPGSKLRCFPMKPLEQAIPAMQVAA